MSKFEIINSKWIRIKEGRDVESYKLSSVIELEYLDKEHWLGSMYKIRLYLSPDDCVEIKYDSNERKLLKQDLKLLENLLYNQ